jgi:hypothetical protein
MTRILSALALALTLAGCAAAPWPDPPAIDQAAYRATYDAWRQGQTETAVASKRHPSAQGYAG